MRARWMYVRCVGAGANAVSGPISFVSTRLIWDRLACRYSWCCCCGDSCVGAVAVVCCCLMRCISQYQWCAVDMSVCNCVALYGDVNMLAFGVVDRPCPVVWMCSCSSVFELQYCQCCRSTLLFHCRCSGCCQSLLWLSMLCCIAVWVCSNGIVSTQCRSNVMS